MPLVIVLEYFMVFLPASDHVTCYATPELNRYFRAAEEAAQEVLMEQQQTISSGDDAAAVAGAAVSEEGNEMTELVNTSQKNLDSPSRLIALQLANNNPVFRCVSLCHKIVDYFCLVIKYFRTYCVDFFVVFKKIVGSGKN